MKKKGRVLCLILAMMMMAMLAMGSGSSGGSSSSSGGSSSSKTCPSCGKTVSSLKTRKDNAGVSRTWCSSCWSDYDDIMGN